MGGFSIGRVAVVSDPAAIRRVLLENSSNYQKGWMQRRILSAGMANGLLSAEGNQRKAQRRALALLFARKAVLAFSAAMVDSAQALVERLAQIVILTFCQHASIGSSITPARAMAYRRQLPASTRSA